MLLRLVSSRPLLLLLAAVTLVVPPLVLGLYGLFRGYGENGERVFSWGTTAWLVGPYVAFAALVVWAAHCAHQGFRIAVAVTAVVVVVQSVAMTVLTLSSDDSLAAVGVVASPVLYFGGAAVLAVVGALVHLRSRGRSDLAGQGTFASTPRA